MHRLVIACLVVALAGCERTFFDPDRATRPYPRHLHEAESLDVQVFRRGTTLEVVNSLPMSFVDCDVWINQRYVRHVDEIPVGRTVRLSLWDFWDERGNRFSAGGFWRTRETEPVRLVELQVGEQDALVGLIMIVEE